MPISLSSKPRRGSDVGGCTRESSTEDLHAPSPSSPVRSRAPLVILKLHGGKRGWRGVGDKGVCEFAVCKSKTPRVILWTNPALQALLLYSTQIYAPSQSAVSSLAVGDQREELLQNLDGGRIRGPYTDACINTCIR